MPVEVHDKNGTVILKIDANSVDTIINEIALKRRINQNRIRLTKDGRKMISSDSVLDGDILHFKDLGLQVSWTAVFLIEYFGPIVIHALFAFFPGAWYGSEDPLPQLSQKIAFTMIILHYLKRELETIMVHRFSNGTMPWTNLPKNCFHYWILGGVALAYPIYDPSYKMPQLSTAFLYAMIGLWGFAELSNLKTHLILRDLRPVGSSIRKIPRGYGFDLVACPNYFFEILGWIAFSTITGSYSSWFFTLAGAVQMWQWALKKHLQYKKEFGKEYPKRKVLIPFLL